MKKFISLFLAFSFLHVHATLPVTNTKALSTALDNLNYSLTVEWDQKDQAFYQSQKDQFENAMKELQAKGMSNDEMIKVVANKTKNQKIAQELKDLMAVVETNKLSKSEARKFVVENLNNQYADGANWLGHEVAATFGLILLFAVILAVASASSTGGTYDGSYNNCYDEYVCYEYYDYYWGWVEDCGWEYNCY